MKIGSKNNFKNNIDKETDIYYHILNRKDIVKFTYEDYLRCLKLKNEEKYNILNEKVEDYEIINEANINNGHDKIYRKILGNKNYAAYIINEVLKVEIKPEDIEKYNSSFVTNELKNRESDIVYKLKNRNIFFLIEHQSKVDYSMPYRIKEYELEIMKSAIDIKKVKTKKYELPSVIPLVIYTGKAKWNVSLYLNNIQDERFKNIDLLKYNLLDINQYTKEKLLESKNFIDKIFLIEKTQNSKELVEILRKVIKETNDEEEKTNLKIIMKTTLKEKLGEEKIQELIKEMEGGNENMLAVVEMIRKENRMIKQEGIKEGIKTVISNMLKNGISIEQIENMTGITKKEIEQVKKTIKNNKE